MKDDWKKDFRKLIYEPEHTETTCWCEPKFIKREDGRLVIVHQEQRDVLTSAVSKLIDAARLEAVLEKQIGGTVQAEDEETVPSFISNVK